MTSLGLEWNPYVTQIEPHDYIAGAASAGWGFSTIAGLPGWWLQAVLLSHFSRDDNYVKHHFAHAAHAVNATLFHSSHQPRHPSPSRQSCLTA